jgi:hypothetical protein
MAHRLGSVGALLAEVQPSLDRRADRRRGVRRDELILPLLSASQPEDRFLAKTRKTVGE